MGKTTELSPIAALTGAELMMVVDDPSGVTPVSKSALVSQVAGWRKIASQATQTATISNDATEQTLFSLTIPANALAIGDLVLLRGVNEVTALASGQLRQRVWIGPVGGVPLVTGYFAKTSAGRTGWEYNWFSVVDTGSGLASARLAGADYSGIDVAAIDLTIEQTVHFTAQMTVADAGNAYRGLSAHLMAL
jgi:hypothetical protein